MLINNNLNSFYYIQIVNQKVQEDGDTFFLYAYNKENKQVYIIYYQNNTMKDNFAKYGDIIYVDSTYKLNKNRYPVTLFVVKDFFNFSG